MEMEDEQAAKMPQSGRLTPASGTETCHSDREEEARIRILLAAGDVGRGLTATVRLYGGEVYGFVVALVEEPSHARELYQRVTQEVERKLPAFAFACGLRTWMYSLTRRELAAYRERAGDLMMRDSFTSGTGTPKPGVGPLGQAAFRGLAPTLRRKLTPEDREILILRVDRRLSWRNLALTGMDEDPAEEAIDRECERLMGRFAFIRQKLGRIARHHGILAGE